MQQNEPNKFRRRPRRPRDLTERWECTERALTDCQSPIASLLRLQERPSFAPTLVGGWHPGRRHFQQIGTASTAWDGVRRRHQARREEMVQRTCIRRLDGLSAAGRLGKSPLAAKRPEVPGFVGQAVRGDSREKREQRSRNPRGGRRSACWW